LISIAESVASPNNFRILQFPFNLLENEAASERAGGSLIQRIRSRGLTSMGNRPLSGRRAGRTIRFSQFDFPDEDMGAAFGACIALVDSQLESLQIEHTTMDFMVMQFLRDNLNGVGDPELLDLIFAQHVFPFVAELWGSESTGPEHQTFAGLHAMLRRKTLTRLQENAAPVRAELVKDGLIAHDDARSLAVVACDFALRSGVDHVVVGMRSPQYVESLRTLMPNWRN
jgi:hypothetical protein